MDDLDRYEQTGDPAELRAAAHAPARTLDADRCERLSAALTGLADETGSAADYDLAIAWTDRLAAVLAPADPDLGPVLLRRADLIWDRWWVVDDAAELDATVQRLAGTAPPGVNHTIARYLRMLHGVALQQQAEAGRGDLDRAVAILGSALDELAGHPVAEDGSVVADHVSDGRLAMGAAALSEALRWRAARDERLPDLDRAVATLNRAIRDLGAQPEIRQMLASRLALRYQQRWHGRLLFGDPAGASADLDAGIAACAIAEEGGNPWMTGLRGELLYARAEHTGQPEDARAAAEVLDAAARRVGGDPDVWRLWRSAANANRLLTDDLDALTRAARQLDNALGCPPPVAELLPLHSERVLIGQHLVQHGRTDGPPLRDAVEAGIRALDAAGEASLELRATASLRMAFGSFTAAAADLGEVDADRIGRLLRVAGRLPGADAEWQAMVNYGLGVVEHYAGMLDPAGHGDRGLTSLARAAAFEDPNSDFAQRLRLVLTFAGQAASGYTGDRRIGVQARRQGDPDRPLPDRAPPPGQAAVGPNDLLVAEVYTRLMELLQANDPAGAGLAAREALPRLEAAGLSGMDADFLRMVRAVAAMSDPASTVRPRFEPRSGIGADLQLNVGLVELSARLAQMIARGDVAGIERCADGIEAVVAAAGPDRRIRLAGAALAGQAHLEAASRGASAHARRAADWFRTAMTNAGGVGFPLWPSLAMGRAWALRLAADPDRRQSRELGLSAMQAHAWQVFAQAGTDNAIASARAAAADARIVAGWCLADRHRDRAALDQLVTVLDASRGLVLRATTTSRLIADRLAQAGHAELAGEWQATAGQGRDLVSGLAMPGSPAPGGVSVPDDLRLRVLRALDDGRVTGYEPITAGEIRDGLRRAGSDALIYLLAGEPSRPGVAVVVPSTGDPAVIELPGLRLDANSPVRDFVRARRARDVYSPEYVTDPADGLAELCGWAWDAVMGLVLGRLRRRPARIVLIPMGSLGLVPWHAAADRRQSPIRYAAQHAVISYSPSARSFCATAGLARGAITSALIVGDPTGDLPYAGEEATAVHRRFYPHGSYLGPPTAAGTPADVLAWIDTRPAGPALLHFACHGAVDPASPADARLLLAGPAGLTTRTLLERSQNAALNLQEVFLAACTTSVGGDDHDEVLSLSSAFLAAGAATVFGSLWKVPDGETSVLMFKIHQFLRADGLAPADALHQAQLWMLDPARRTDGLPPELRRHVRPGQIFPPASWAGFLHAGR